MSTSVIHPVLRVRPIVKAIWNIYGVPEYSRHLLQCAMEEVFTAAQVPPTNHKAKKGKRK
jgi:hypothetical protein